MSKGKKIQFETFLDLGTFEIGQLTQLDPSVFNGIVRVKKFRVTIEEIEESDEIIRERIQKLWDECDNLHGWGPLKTVAQRYDLELSHETRKRRP